MNVDVRHEPAATPVSTGRLSTTWELDLDFVPGARFASLVVERAFPHHAATNWPTERMTLDGVFPFALATFRDRNERSAILDLGEVAEGDCLVALTLEYERAYVRIAAHRVETLANAEAWMREQYPETAATTEQRVTVCFLVAQRPRA